MTTITDLSSALNTILGDDAVSTSGTLTAAPGTAEEAARVLTAAREAGAAVIFRGGGTGQRIGLPPVRADLVLETRRLNRLVEWEPADLTVCVEAGMPLARLQEALARQGQQVPIEAPVPERATIGGLVAANRSGPRRWLHGGWRDLVIGMHMALPDGTVIKSGGRVVKNVQGYDLAKLFTGALGSLGLIIQVNLKLAPLPETRRLLIARGSLPAVAAYLESVAASTARVSTLDLLDEHAARAVGLAGDHHAGLVLIEGPRIVVDAQSTALTRNTTVRIEPVEEPALAPLWAAWRDLARTDDLGENEALLTISTLPSDVPAALEALRAAAQQQGCRAFAWARAGNGVTAARLTASAAAPVAIAAVQTALLARWPATTLTAGSHDVARAARPWGAEPPGIGSMRALKTRFDPTGILQPGRYIFGEAGK